MKAYAFHIPPWDHFLQAEAVLQVDIVLIIGNPDDALRYVDEEPHK